MRAAMVFADVDLDFRPVPANTSFYRIVTPAEYLKRAGHDIVVSHLAHLKFGDLPEVVMIERELRTDNIRQLRRLGAKRIVATFDDHYGMMTPAQGAYRYWKENFGDFKEALKMCDLAIVPSLKLVEDFAPFCKMQYVPNYLDPELWFKDVKLVDKEPGQIIVGWGGSTGHLESWLNTGVAPALRAVQRKYSEVKLRVYTGGGEIEDILYRHQLNFERKSWVGFGEWPRHVRSMDIGIAMLSGPYDMRRSNLKPLEYAIAGRPFVYSNELPYDRVVGGYPAKSQRDWEAKLSLIVEAIINNRTELSQDILKAQSWALDYMIDRRISEYERILWG